MGIKQLAYLALQDMNALQFQQSQHPALPVSIPVSEKRRVLHVHQAVNALVFILQKSINVNRVIFQQEVKENAHYANREISAQVLVKYLKTLVTTGNGQVMDPPHVKHVQMVIYVLQMGFQKCAQRERNLRPRQLISLKVTLLVYPALHLISVQARRQILGIQ